LLTKLLENKSKLLKKRGNCRRKRMKVGKQTRYGCSKADGSPMMLDECEAGQSLCCLTDGKGWECRAAFPRQHILHGDPSSKLHGKCLKHRLSQYSSSTARANHTARRAVYRKMRQGTAKESERQKKKRAKKLGRSIPTGDLRKFLRLLRPTFADKLAETARGKLFAATMETIDRLDAMPPQQRPKDCAVAAFDVEMLHSDSKTGLPVSSGLFQVGTAMHTRSS
jgi:hypothetical protein